MLKLNSICAEATVGTISGYDLGGQKATSMAEFAEVVQSLSERIYDETGIYVSTVISNAVVSYHHEWGCLRSGEPVFKVTSDCNPQFQTEEKFKETFLILINLLKKHYKQSAITVTFRQQEIVYLN